MCKYLFILIYMDGRVNRRPSFLGVDLFICDLCDLCESVLGGNRPCPVWVFFCSHRAVVMVLMMGRHALTVQ